MASQLRLFSTEEDAKSALDRLQSVDILAAPALLLSPESGADTEAVHAAIAEGRLPGVYVHLATKALEDGQSLLAVRAHFGQSERAAALMEAAGGMGGDALPEVSSRNPAPFSDFLGIPVLSRGRPSPGLATGYSFSDYIGFKELSTNATPLSSLLRLPVLSKAKSAWTRSFGLPLLSTKAAPLSSSVGMPVLKAEKPEWTHSFGLPLLMSNPAPLSSFLGWKPLSDSE